MKKIPLFLALSLISANAFAQFQPIPQDRLGDYKTAVGWAILNFSCSGGDTSLGAIIDEMNNADNGEIDASGSQPLLVFSSSSEESSIVVSVTTSADYKSVVSVNAKEYSMGQHNSGDLRNPNIQSGWDLISSETCRPATR